MNKISKNRLKKEQLVAELTEKVGKAKALVFANYQGMTHKQLEGLKKALKKVDAEMLVAKNTLLKLALKKQESGSMNQESIENPNSNLEGPTITLFAYGEVIGPLKEIAKSIKNLKIPTVKFGLAKRDPASQDITWEFLTDAAVMRLSTLPSREVLLAQLVAGLKSPIFALHRALEWNLRKLVLTLRSIENHKFQNPSTK